MPLSTKVNLSAKELEMVKSEEVILMRTVIMHKAYMLLSERVPVIDECFRSRLPEFISNNVIHAKISRGEQYLGFPYLILDHPRIFDRENIFALRTMFWWSKFFSVTLHVSGSYLLNLNSAITGNYDAFRNNFFICVNDDPWQHHFERNNFVPVKEINKEEWNRMAGSPFIKLAVKFNLQQWHNIPMLLDETYKLLGEIFNCQGGETGPLPGIPTTGSDL